MDISTSTQVNTNDYSLENESLHTRDVNSHEIFKNNVLTSQFLKDYTGLSIFSDIRPEDIEDETKKFRMILGTEVEGDSIKRVHLRISGESADVYVISLIEHKSQPDPDTAMQILIYMTAIWREYARNMNSKRKNASKTVSFRYPPIIPIIYYEGSREWTSSIRLSDRIAHVDIGEEYIPDFSCKFVPLRDYNNQELIEHNNEMSLIMMINKIQKPEDFHEFREHALEYMKTIYSDTSTDIQQLIQEVVWSLLMKIKVPEDKARDLLKDVRDGDDMGILFENLEPWDWQGEHERAEREKARADEAETKADEAEARADEAEARADEAEARADEAEARLDEVKARANKAVSDSVYKTKRDTAKGLYSAGVSIEQISAGLSEDTKVIESWIMEN